MYKFTPTLLTFGLSCPSCFYAKVKSGWQEPSQPFPSLFGVIDRCLRYYWNGKFFEWDRIPGILDTKQYTVKSQAIKIKGFTPFYFSGRTDCLIINQGQCVGIVDFKASAQLKTESIESYRRQLHVYAWALEKPEKPKISVDRQIQTLGLLNYCPDQVMSPTLINFRVDWIPVERDDNWFSVFLENVLGLLDGPPPPANPACSLCSFRLSQTNHADS